MKRRSIVAMAGAFLLSIVVAGAAMEVAWPRVVGPGRWRHYLLIALFLVVVDLAYRAWRHRRPARPVRFWTYAGGSLLAAAMLVGAAACMHLNRDQIVGTVALVFMGAPGVTGVITGILYGRYQERAGIAKQANRK